jgi:PIN domain nuclease of toxin-antitoxin system
MFACVVDTHALIWYLYGDSRLSQTARQFMSTASDEGQQLAVSSITLVEMVYLIEKGRIAAESLSVTISALNSHQNALTEIPLGIGVVRAMSTTDAAQIPDMPDRIIAATAVYLQVPLISRDARIRVSSLQTIW